MKEQIGAGVRAGGRWSGLRRGNAQQARPDKKAIAAELQKISAPAAEHHNFDPFLGSFDEEIEYEGAGTTGADRGDASGQWVLGNRFLELNAPPTCPSR